MKKIRKELQKQEPPPPTVPVTSTGGQSQASGAPKTTDADDVLKALKDLTAENADLKNKVAELERKINVAETNWAVLAAGTNTIASKASELKKSKHGNFFWPFFFFSVDPFFFFFFLSKFFRSTLP